LSSVEKKQLNESDWFLARWLPSTYPTLCCKEIWTSQKIRLLPSGTLLDHQKRDKLEHLRSNN